MEGCVMVLNYLFMRDQMYRDDFRVALTKSAAKKNQKTGGTGVWLGKGR